jgi:hypothetical protein
MILARVNPTVVYTCVGIRPALNAIAELLQVREVISGCEAEAILRTNPP